MRTRGEGTYFELGGKFCWRLKHDGRSHVRKADTAKELRAKVRECLKEIDEQGAHLSKDARDVTVAGWLNGWLEQFVKPSRARKTYRQYEQVVRLYILPAIGTLRLKNLTALQVQAMLNALSSRGLSPTTVALTRTILRTAIQAAVKQRMILHNPVDATEKPKAGPLKKRTMTPGQMEALLAELMRTELVVTRKRVQEERLVYRYGPMLTFLLSTGPRISESLAILWLEIDRKAQPRPVARINRTLEWEAAKKDAKGKEIEAAKWWFSDVKTHKSRRAVPLNSRALAALDAQWIQQERERKSAGKYYTELGLVFTTETGQPVRERNVQRALDYALTAIGLPHFSLHDLRRSFGTALAANNPIHIVQAILGHEQSSTTLKHYVTPFEEDMAAAVTGLDAKVAG
jgi:integrase